VVDGALDVLIFASRSQNARAMRHKWWMEPTDARGDAELLAATAREPIAFDSFYRRYARQVFAYLMTKTQRADVAADLTAETFAAALAGAASYRGDAPTAAGWVLRIAHNKLVSSTRRGQVEDEARRRLAMAPLVLTDEGLEALGGGDDERLAGLLAELPAEQRDALLSRVVDERDYADIAHELACSESVVRKRVSRGLAHLRARLTEEG
jgi:RNA polymerase sigma-70 factor (ECF subfamily)